jgi:hypothetical protein
MQNLKKSIPAQVTEVDLVYRNQTNPEECATVTQPDDAYDLFLKTWDMDKIDLQEQFRIMLLDRSHHCLGVSTVATGGIALCLVDLKIVIGPNIVEARDYRKQGYDEVYVGERSRGIVLYRQKKYKVALYFKDGVLKKVTANAYGLSL